MCDILLATPSATAERVMLFGKNSDRERNEAQVVQMLPRADHAPNTELTCTYIKVPQVRRTHAVLLCRPFWIWGAEMGANEHGVVIGNEGLYGRIPDPQKNALIGMDLLRLALERAVSAAEALNVITSLLEQHGQGGNCGYLRPSYYNNSFMIADAGEAFVLETIGREWVAERVGGVRALSNAYSIGPQVARISSGMEGFVRDFGWNESGSPNYAEWLADPRRTHIGSAAARFARSTSLLSCANEPLNAMNFMSILRDHDPTGQHDSEWSPRTSTKFSLCIHAGVENKDGQTTGSMVSEVRLNDSVHWVTGTAAPCISIFKPVLMDVPLPSLGPSPTSRFEASALWWRHERLHRAALMRNFPQFIRDIRQERNALEADFHVRVAAVLNGGSRVERSQVIDECWQEAYEMEDRWFAGLCSLQPEEEGTPYDIGWLKMNDLAGL